jgi:hypothetical protein
MYPLSGTPFDVAAWLYRQPQYRSTLKGVSLAGFSSSTFHTQGNRLQYSYRTIRGPHSKTYSTTSWRAQSSGPTDSTMGAGDSRDTVSNAEATSFHGQSPGIWALPRSHLPSSGRHGMFPRIRVPQSRSKPHSPLTVRSRVALSPVTCQRRW